MRSSLRRFVYLVVDGKRPRTLDLHRIDMSRFFRSPPPPGAIMDARLPRPIMTFYAPSSEGRNGMMQFLLLDSNKVLATDQTGHATIYDAGLNALRTAPTLSRPKHNPLSVAVRDRLYVLDSSRIAFGSCAKEHCFEALVYEHGGPDGGAWYDDWRYHSLPAPPYRPGDISAYAVVGGSEVWVSREGEGTYSFDTARCSWSKQGEWSLPFCGLAEYVPEYKIWFGLSSSERSNLFCAFDLAAAARRHSPPVPRNVWEDLWPPKGWDPVTSSLVHLGGGRFCIARLFMDDRGPEACGTDDDESFKMFSVFTAVEVERCGKAGKGLQMVRHRSECYSLGYNLNHWVL